MGLAKSDLGEVARVRWKIGHDFFHVTTVGIRKMLQKEPKEHVALKKWKIELGNIPLNLRGSIWMKGKEEKVNFFMWQLVYRAPATQH